MRFQLISYTSRSLYIVFGFGFQGLTSKHSAHRLQSFPAGAGKGFDTAVLLAWLQDVCHTKNGPSPPEASL